MKWARTALGLAFVVSCIGSGDREPQRIAMPANDWGIVALEVGHVDGVEHRFELRGVDSSDREVASVRLRVGTIADLGDYLPDTDTLGNNGSEMVLRWRGAEDRRVSRETELFFLRASMPELQRFLQVPTVSAALAKAHILVTSSHALAPSESPYGTLGYGHPYDWGCSANMLLTSPVASQCCWDNGYNNTYCDTGVQRRFFDGCYFEQDNGATVFKNPNGNAVTRTYNTNGNGGCRAADGVSACSGTDCFYGPYGFSRATVGSVVTYIGVVYSALPNGYSYTCNPGGANANLADVTGTLPTGAGCCIDGTGPCADASACSACGGGGDAGRGTWDY